MNRKQFIQTALIAPIAAFFGIKAIAKEPKKHTRMKDIMIDRMNEKPCYYIQKEQMDRIYLARIRSAKNLKK